MMTSLFSAFDLNLNNQIMTLSLAYAFIPMLIGLNSFWINSNHSQTLFLQMSHIANSMSTSTSLNLVKNSNTFNGLTFYMILILNFSGAMPIFTTITSHLSFTMSLGFPMWMSMFMLIILKTPNMSQAMLVPESSPLALSWFLAIVEMVSSLIRPITLSFRLAANISAGHVILAMLSSSSVTALLTYLNLSLLTFLLLLSTFYAMFEFAICSVQAYVFSLLTSMYANDYIKTPL